MKRTIITAMLAALVPMSASAHDGHREWRPCHYEDGSGQRRCVWDGRHMGNGDGISIKIRRGGTDQAVYVEITHRRARHLLGSNH